MASKYLIHVSTGPSYDPATHTDVSVNTGHTVKVSSELVEAEVCVRIKDYVHGLRRDAPVDCEGYFGREPHKGNGDSVSIGVRFRLKEPDGRGDKEEEGGGDKVLTEEEEERRLDREIYGVADDVALEGDEYLKKEDDEEEDAPDGVSGTDLQFGNDFDHAIRDRLPPGFGTAMNIVKWWIDPGLEGDPYADRPYLYGPALSSFNAVHVGHGEQDQDKGGLWFDEGGDDEGMEWRREIGVPDDSKQRVKWALKAGNKEKWTWEYGRTYGVDFFNPYFDFREYAVRLPGFHLPVMKYWDGQGVRYVSFLLVTITSAVAIALSPSAYSQGQLSHASRHPRKRSHQFRFVLRNRVTEQVYLVVVFTLHLAEDVNEDGSLKPAALEAMAQAEKGTIGEFGPEDEPELELEPDEEDFGDEEVLGEARRKLSQVNLNGETGIPEEDLD